MTLPGIHMEAPGIARLAIDELSRAGSIDEQFCLQIHEIVATLKGDRGIKALILTGTPEIFCYGASETFIQGLIAHYKNHIEHDYALYLKEILDIPFPVIAAMEGNAIGGGLVLGLYADIVIAAEESRYGMPFMNMGFTPGMGSTAMARSSLGYHTAFEMMVAGRYVKGRELKGKCGFNDILPRDQVMNRARDLAASIAEKSRETLELLKKYLSIDRRKLLEESRTAEAFMHRISFNLPDIEERIYGNFGGGS